MWGLGLLLLDALKYWVNRYYRPVVVGGVFPTLTKKDVPELSTNQLATITNVILDDSRRIDDMIGADYPLEHVRKAYRGICLAKFCDKKYWDGPAEAAEADFEPSRERHWKRLTTNMGINLRAIFDSGLTNPKDQNLAGNFSIDGGLADSLDLARMRDPREYHSTVFHMLGSLGQYYEIAGFDRHRFYTSNHFTNLLKSCFGESDGGRLYSSIQREIGGLDRQDHDIILGKAVGMVTDEFVRRAGVEEKSVWQMNNEELMSRLESDRELREKTGVKLQSVSAIRRSISSGNPLFLRKDHVRVLCIPAKELDWIRGDCDLELRGETAMSMREHRHDLAVMYEEKFGHAA